MKPGPSPQEPPRPSAKAVSVVIICFNQGRYLAEAIESAFAQTTPADEVIVVDDGSSDETPQVAAAFGQALYLRQANAGRSSARNAGLQRARGDHVLFLDADDALTPNALADALACFAGTPDAAFVYGGHREVGPDRSPLRDIPPDKTRQGYAGLLKGNHIAMLGAVLYRTAVLRAAGGFDPALAACEDYEVYLRLSRSHAIASFPTIAAEYRRHDSNTSRDAGLMLGKALAVLRRHRPAADATPDLHLAYREGVRFWRDHYGERLVGQVRRELGDPGTWSKAAGSMIAGLRNDPSFIWRVLRRAGGQAPRPAG